VTEYVLKDFVYDHETQHKVDRSASPVKPEVFGVRVSAPLIHWKQHRKGQNLKTDIGEENRKNAMQLVAQHRGPNSQLQYRVGDPERELVVGGHQPVSSQPGRTVDRSTAAGLA
jgi:hypothetical protein